MVPHTRRRFLHVATAVAGGLAGCGRLTGGAARSSESTADNGGSDVPASGSETDPQTVLLRADSETPPIRLTDSERENTDSPRPGHYSPRITTAVVDSRSRSQRLTVADGVDGDAVSSFVSATEFDSETLYLETNRLQECFRLELCRISWQPDEVQTDYGRVLRPYDERCGADERAFESRLIRLPVALDEESVNSHGSTIRGSPCDATGGPRAEGSSGRGESARLLPRATEGGER